MRRLLLPVFVSVLLVVAGCASTSTTAGQTTSPAAGVTSDRPATGSTTPGSMTESEMAESMTESVSADMTHPMSEASTTPADAAATGTVITTGSSDFGEILFDGNHQAIYLFDKETAGVSECYDDCAAAWPPVLTTGAPAAAGGINGALLGTTARTDGTTQVTYGGHPLYYYVDEAPGEVKCHNVRGFGGLWLVVTPGGQAAPV